MKHAIYFYIDHLHIYFHLLVPFVLTLCVKTNESQWNNIREQHELSADI